MNTEGLNPECPPESAERPEGWQMTDPVDLDDLGSDVFTAKCACLALYSYVESWDEPDPLDGWIVLTAPVDTAALEETRESDPRALPHKVQNNLPPDVPADECREPGSNWEKPVDREAEP